MEITTGYNSRFAKAGVSCLYDSEVLNSSFVHLRKFSAENPAFAKRQTVMYKFELQFMFINQKSINIAFLFKINTQIR
jgi:hypothetical protein